MKVRCAREEGKIAGFGLRRFVDSVAAINGCRPFAFAYWIKGCVAGSHTASSTPAIQTFVGAPRRARPSYSEPIQTAVLDALLMALMRRVHACRKTDACHATKKHAKSEARTPHPCTD